MNGRTIRLLAIALGIGSLAGAASAQESEAMSQERGTGEHARSRRYARGTGYGGSAESEFSESQPAPRASRLRRSRAMDDSFGAQADPASRTAPFDDNSGYRSRHVPAGPDAALGESEVMRLGGARRKAAQSDEPASETNRIDSEIDKIDEQVRTSRPARAGRNAQNAQNSARSDDDSPMRSSWRGPRGGKKLRAPFQDDPDAGKEERSAGSDPRHSRRSARPEAEAGEAAAAKRGHEGAHRRAQRDAAAPIPTENSTHDELMATERQLLMMKRKNASPEQIEDVQAKAAKLRAQWRRSVGSAKPAAARPTDEEHAISTYRPSGAEPEISRPPFWRQEGSEELSPSGRYEHAEGEGHDVAEERMGPITRPEHF